MVSERKQEKRLKTTFSYAIEIGMLSEVEANELKELLEYRNDIAHRIHEVMADISRSYWASDHLAYTPPTYRGDALGRLRTYRQLLSERAGSKLIISLSMDGILFELTEDVLEADLNRLERILIKQVADEHKRAKAINEELKLDGTELVGDLAPRFPANHRSDRSYGDEYIPATGHLTTRGVEICYRLFDLGKSPMVVAHLMGMTLRSAERRRDSWKRAGGVQRIRADVDRYDLNFRPRVSSSQQPDPIQADGEEEPSEAAVGGTK